MITVTGAMSRSTATFGIRAKLRRTGHPTAMATGTGSGPGVGPGLTIRHGVSRLTITAAGITSAAGGAGARARSLARQSMAPLLLVSSVAALASESAGSRWDSVNHSSPGSVAAGIS